MSRCPESLCTVLARVAIALLTLVPSVAPETGHADAIDEIIDGAVLTAAHAEPARTGEATRLRFSIENFSGRDLVLQNVRSDRAGRATMFWAGPGSLEHQAEQLFVPDETTIDFGTSHMGITLADLTTELRPGDRVEFELVFRSGTVIGSAHVHAVSLDATAAGRSGT